MSQAEPASNLPSKWCAVDPGESLGYTILWENRLEVSGTADLWDFIHAFAIAHDIKDERDPGDRELVKRLRGTQLLVYEQWALYPWKLQELAWDECRTARGIGALEFICQVAGIPYQAQAAAIKDAAESAGATDLFLRPLYENRHANDSTLHAVYKAMTVGEAVVPGT